MSYCELLLIFKVSLVEMEYLDQLDETLQVEKVTEVHLVIGALMVVLVKKAQQVNDVNVSQNIVCMALYILMYILLFLCILIHLCERVLYR